MIRINLLDYKEELERIAVQKKVVACLGVLFAFFLSIILVWIQKQTQIVVVQEEAAAVQEKVNGLEKQVRAIRKMKVKKRRADQIIEGINNLRKNQTSPSKMLEDLTFDVPKEVWLEAIRQVDKKYLKRKNIDIAFEDGSNEIIIIEGVTLKESSILDYSEKIQNINYYKSVVLYKIEKTLLNNSPVWEFVLLCHKEAGPNDKKKKKKKKK